MLENGRARGRGREGGAEGGRREGVIKSKAQRQNKFQKANVGAISRMTQVCAWPASSGCGVGIKSNFLSICHLLGVGLVFSFNMPGDSLLLSPGLGLRPRSHRRKELSPRVRAGWGWNQDPSPGHGEAQLTNRVHSARGVEGTVTQGRAWMGKGDWALDNTDKGLRPAARVHSVTPFSLPPSQCALNLRR